MTKKLTRALVYGADSEIMTKVQAFEQELNSGDPYPKYDSFGHVIPKTIRDVPLKKLAVGYDDEIVETKVYDLVVRGAWEDENIWRRAAKVVNMSAEIERVPMITPDDFSFAKWARGTAMKTGGGAFWHVELNCSGGAGLYALDVGIDKQFVKYRGFDAVEEALACVGQAAGRLIFKEIVAEYLTDVDSTMTNTWANWGNLHYGSLVKMESLIAKVGMSPTVALINPDEGYDVGISDYFIKEDYYNAARGIPKDLHNIGNLYGRIPILRHRDVTAASMIMAVAEKSVAVGILEDVTIEGYDDVRKGLEGAGVSLQFDVKSSVHATGPAGATNPCAKAWATTTAA